MKADRTVSVPRPRIAKELGRQEQRIAEVDRLANAKASIGKRSG
jgi:hypothetical protein